MPLQSAAAAVRPARGAGPLHTQFQRAAPALPQRHRGAESCAEPDHRRLLGRAYTCKLRRRLRRTLGDRFLRWCELEAEPEPAPARLLEEISAPRRRVMASTAGAFTPPPDTNATG